MTHNICSSILCLANPLSLWFDTAFIQLSDISGRYTTDIPSVNLALPPVGWHSTVEHPTHSTTVCAWLNTVVIL